MAEDENVANEPHVAPFILAHRAQQLALLWIEPADPARGLSRVWDVFYSVPRCGVREDRAVVAEILRRILLAFRARRLGADDSVHSRLHRSGGCDLHVARTLAYLARRFNANDVCLEAAARECGVSAPYLSHLIAQVTGYGFRTHLRGLRVACAGDLLATTPLSIKEVARESGFVRVTAMDREFELWFHMSPSEFRCLATPTAVIL